MKEYEALEMEVIVFDVEDVIGISNYDGAETD